MDKLTIRSQALQMLARSQIEADAVRASQLQLCAKVLLAQAEHLERTGHYIELPAHLVNA